MSHFFLMERPGGHYQLCDASMNKQDNGLCWGDFIDGAKLRTDQVEEPILVDLRYPEDVMPEIFESPLLISDEFLADLLNFGIDNIDAYECHLIDGESGKVWTNYKLCNIIGLLDVFDMQASTLNDGSSPEVALLFDDIVINESKAAGHHLFRPAGKMSSILVSQELKDYIEGLGKYKNVEFVHPSEYA